MGSNFLISVACLEPGNSGDQGNMPSSTLWEGCVQGSIASVASLVDRSLKEFRAGCRQLVHSHVTCKDAAGAVQHQSSPDQTPIERRYQLKEEQAGNLISRFSMCASFTM